MHMRNKE